MKILIIEDQRNLSNDIKQYLETENYLCEQAFTYDEAAEKLEMYEYDCIVLDLMLPGGNGLDLLRIIRNRQDKSGIIIASAKDALDDKIKGLELGADDYIAKPFHLAELSMRIYSIIRRKKFDATNTLENNGLVVNLLTHRVSVGDKEISLTRSEYDLLLFLIGNADRVVSKSAVAEHLSGDAADLMDNHDFVYTHIKNLKAKLSKAGIEGVIKTVYGTGYKWTTL